MMKKLGNEVTDVEIKDIITESGSSKASGITYAEFQKLMGMGIKNLREPEDPEDELRHAFRLFDQDGDGAWRPNPDPHLRPPPRRAAASGSPLPVRLLRLRPRRAAPGRAPPRLPARSRRRLPCSSQPSLSYALPQDSSPPRSSARLSPATATSKRPTRRWSRS